MQTLLLYQSSAWLISATVARFPERVRLERKSTVVGGHVVCRLFISFKTEWVILLIKSELSPIKSRRRHEKVAQEDLVPSDSVNAESLVHTKEEKMDLYWKFTFRL